jgi:hypothetical protein
MKCQPINKLVINKLSVSEILQAFELPSKPRNQRKNLLVWFVLGKV